MRAVAFKQKVGHVEQLDAEIGIRQLVARALVDSILEVSDKLLESYVKLSAFFHRVSLLGNVIIISFN